ncbi:MAG TPA: FAD-dependent monooxygenase [Azoarcus sp.]|nr:FAD-dependent monooxygenase [Azoarcus sp.]
MTDVDILVVGGGPAGLALALSLARSGKRIVVADAREREVATTDPRALALAHGSRLILEQLGVWDDLDATPIETIHISQRNGFGRTVLRHTELDVPALGYVVSAGALIDALRRAVDATDIEVRDATLVETLSPGDSANTAQLTGPDGPATLSARLVARAEGGPGNDACVRARNYDQLALIATVCPRDPHNHTAFERFTTEGPFALLPLGNHYASVLVVSETHAERLTALDDSAYLDHLQQTVGGRTRLLSVGPRMHFPLALRYRKTIVEPRTAWLGNAAQTLHPVAGQGFNLALRDVHTLSRAVRDATDPGSPALLAAWARARRLDRGGTIGFTDGLIRVFTTNVPPISCARGFGLFTLDVCPPLRNFIARRMMFGARAWP